MKHYVRAGEADGWSTRSVRQGVIRFILYFSLRVHRVCMVTLTGPPAKLMLMLGLCRAGPEEGRFRPRQ